MPLSPQEIQAFPRIISAARFGTYLHEMGHQHGPALDLYLWNLEISAAFMVPLQIFEVATRNGVVEVIELVHGPNWPAAAGFVRSLPRPASHYQYDPQRNLRDISARHGSPGKIIADLNFAFWEKIFTAGQDRRLWEPHLRTAFPNVPFPLTIGAARAKAFDILNKARKLRNRIAHHEPIFSRDLFADYTRLHELISWRCSTSAAWLEQNQRIKALLTQRP